MLKASSAPAKEPGGSACCTSQAEYRTKQDALSCQNTPAISLLGPTFLTRGLFSKHFTVVTLPLKFSFPPKSLRQSFASQARLQGTACTLQRWVCTERSQQVARPGLPEDGLHNGHPCVRDFIYWLSHIHIAQIRGACTR